MHHFNRHESQLALGIGCGVGHRRRRRRHRIEEWQRHSRAHAFQHRAPRHMPFGDHHGWLLSTADRLLI
jgi:hypothetical protein